jgi:hypothetical protein
MLSRAGLKFTSTELGPLPSASLERRHSVGDLDLYVAISCAAVDDWSRLCRLWSRRIAQRLWHRRGHDHGGCHHSSRRSWQVAIYQGQDDIEYESWINLPVDAPFSNNTYFPRTDLQITAPHNISAANDLNST